ncbi:MAG: hypothetical protein WCC12_09680 [Anaerolineales bacterium]
MTDNNPVETEGTRDRAGIIIPIVAGLIIVAVMLLIAFQEPLTAGFFSTPTPTSMPAPAASEKAPVSAEITLSPAVQTVDQYLRFINEAKSNSELSRAWDLMAEEFRCNPTDKCSLENFNNRWWSIQIRYKLYDCGPDTVAAELIYYGRNALPDLSGSPSYIEYGLIEDGAQLRINRGSVVAGIGASCKLAVSVP